MSALPAVEKALLLGGQRQPPPTPPCQGGMKEQTSSTRRRARKSKALGPATGMKKRTPLDGRRPFLPPCQGGGRGGWFSRREPAPSPGFEFWPSFRQSFPTKAGGNAESIFKQNGNTPAFHLPVIGANQSKKEEQRRNKWIPAQGRNDGNIEEAWAAREPPLWNLYPLAPTGGHAGPPLRESIYVYSV